MNVLSDTVRVRANLHSSSVLHLWIKARHPDRAAEVSVRCDAGANAVTSVETVEFDFVVLRPGQEGWVDLTWRDGETAVSYIYAFDPKDVLETGISILFIADDTRSPSLPGNYHFRPPLGWMNDPNGFSKVGDTYHLFYQHYPHAQHWSAMHWGHATSRNLLDWVHQPILLRPHAEIGRDSKGMGGILSGSAVPLESGNGLRVFYTDSLPNRSPSTDVQCTAVVADGVMAQNPNIIVDRLPEGLGLGADFRDPYVFKGPDGRYRMVVGSSDPLGGVILMFHTDDPEGASGWSFHSVLHHDTRPGTRCVECACLVPLDSSQPDQATRWALIYGQLKHTHYTAGPRHPTIVLVGTFDGNQFAPAFEQSMDFASGAYGFQAFADRDGPVAIAWLADWSDWDQKSKFPTSMTLPRRLKLSDNGSALLTPPAENVVNLRTGDMDMRGLQTGGTVTLSEACVEIEITLANISGQFRLDFGHPTTPIAVIGTTEGIDLLLGTDARVNCFATGTKPSELRIFLDTGSIELFIDGGRGAATKRTKTVEPFTSMKLDAAHEVVREFKAWRLKARSD